MNHPHIDEKAYQTAWEDVENIFRSAGNASPQIGFTNRWRMRLEAKREKDQRRQAMMIAVIYALAAFGVLFLILIQLLPGLPEPTDLALLAARWGGAVFSWSRMMVNVIRSLLRVLSGIVPASMWLNFVGGGILLAFWWIAQFRNTAFQRGIR